MPLTLTALRSEGQMREEMRVSLRDLEMGK